MPAIHAGMTKLSFSGSVGERKLMIHFVVSKSFVKWRIRANRPAKEFAHAAKTFRDSITALHVGYVFG
jgi:hypothetical protein